MKKILIVLAIIIAGTIGYYAGSNTWYFDIYHIPHKFNTEQARLCELEYSNALFEGLHWYMRDDTAYWDSVFKKTIEYRKIDSINEGDWEDFYAEDWK